MMLNFDKLRDVFQAAVEKHPPDQWDAYLAEACAGDEDLRRNAAMLLKAHAQGGGPLDRPVLEANGTAAHQTTMESSGTIIGRYTLLEQIGEGGFGVVFLAEQQQPVRRKVALKILKPGMDSRPVIARFEAERQALALMDHPNIARVFDGGETESGRPYFVMELVKGVPITAYCDRDSLAPRERLRLFADVCKAVQHAHQKGVIHRDLKPSNLLVTLHDGVPVVKVIDFGIAKAVGQQLTDKTVYTGFAQFIGTPLYMSPEQAEWSGLDIDTRTDIYSLGVLLYELLTGRTPFDPERLRQVPYDQMRRIIREEEPPKPSTRISTLGRAAAAVATQRQSDPKRLGQLLRGELDWIVMKALEKDRNRRYESASAFAADVERYLDDEPVQACPPSRWYRFCKCARRNKGALVVAAVVLLVLVLLAVSNVQLQVAQARVEAARGAEADQRRRAQGNLELALQALDEIFIQPAEAEVSTKGSQGRITLTPQELEHLGRNLLEKGLGFYEQFAQANSSNPLLQGETGKAYNRVGCLHVTLRQNDEAEAAFRKSMAILEKAAEESPDAPVYRRTLVSDYYWLGYVLKIAGRPKEAEELFRRNVASSERLVADYPGVADHRGQLYQAYWALGDFLKGGGRSQEAEPSYRQAVDVARRLVADFPTAADYRYKLSYAWQELGHVLQERRHYQEAGQAFREAVEAARQFVADFATDTRPRGELYYGYRALGDALKEAGRYQEAVPPYRQAAHLARQFVADSPAVAEHRRNLLLSERSLARLLIHLDRFPEAEQVYRQTIALDEKLAAASPSVPADRVGPSESRAALGDLLCVTGRFREAAEEYCRALEARPACPEWQWKLAWLLANCPDPQYRDPGRAIALAKKLVELPEEEEAPPGSSLGARGFRQGFYWRALGLAYYRAGEWDSAITCWEKASALHGGLCTCGWSVLAMAHWKRGDKEEARRCYERACRWLEENKGGYSKEPCFYWEEEFHRLRAEAAELLGLQDAYPPTGEETPPRKGGP
jgi:tetratricopeptide (TPR) repeat protein